MKQAISAKAELATPRHRESLARRLVTRLLVALLLMIGCSPKVIFAQTIYNYVQNPSFEDTSSCPVSSDQISRAYYWSSIDSIGPPGIGKPDLCHTCGLYYMVSVPDNFIFWQYPRTGNSMARVQTFYDEQNMQVNSSYYRDYLQGRLVDTLTAGKVYCVSFYISLADRSTYAVNRIGAYFDDGTIDTVASANCGLVQSQYTPQIDYIGPIITDTMNWIKVEGSFVANGTERFMTIGNFHSLSSTSYSLLPGGSASHYSWFLVDDVSVTEVGLPANAGNDTTIYEGGTAHLGVEVPQFTQLDWKWYQGSTLVGTGAAIDVQPMVNTTYRLEQTICDSTTKDTVTVFVQPVGVSSVHYSKHIVVYPNPAMSALTVQADDLSVSNYSILNNVGQTLLSGSISSEQTEINIMSLPPGIYLIKLDGVSHTEVRRFIKL